MTGTSRQEPLEVNTEETTKPSVSVIIPVYNDYGVLNECLGRLKRQSLPAEEFEVIVVDNGSDPEKYREIDGKTPSVRQLHQEQRGSYAARNLGIFRSRGDVFAFTDADCRPTEEWLETGVDAIRGKDEVGVVGGDIDVYPEDPEAPTVVEKFEMRHAFHPERDVRLENYTVTANLFTRRSVVEAVGTFDGALFSGGDREWCQRVASCGYELFFEESAIVRHPARKRLKDFLARTERIAEGWHRDEATSRSAADLVATLEQFIGHLGRARELTDEPLKDSQLSVEEKFEVLGVAYFQGLAHYLKRIRLLAGTDE